jgi:uncharacterized protein
MAEDRIEMVRSLYEAFGRGDADAIGRLIGDAEWHEADGMPYGGVYRGAEEVFRNVFGPIAGDVEGFQAEPDELLAAGSDRVLALGRYRGKGAKGEVDVPYAHVWTVRAGAIMKFVQYADTHKYRQAIGR